MCVVLLRLAKRTKEWERVYYRRLGTGAVAGFSLEAGVFGGFDRRIMGVSTIR